MLRRLAIGLFASILTITPFPLKAYDRFAYDIKPGEQLN